MHAWLDLLVHLAGAPVVSIASIRGRARAAGSEFVLACDLVSDDVDGPRAEQFGTSPA
jgi:enoyl-CoA hydratase/carnithine racemase